MHALYTQVTDNDRDMNRRTYLAGVGLVATGLAGCQTPGAKVEQTGPVGKTGRAKTGGVA